MHRFVLLLSLIVVADQAWADLGDYDALISNDIAAGLIDPVSRLTMPIDLDGSFGEPFDFGDGAMGEGKTIEFIVMGQTASLGAVLATGQNTDFELRFDQWQNTGRLGVSLNGSDEVSTVATPTELTHVCFRWVPVSGTVTLNEVEIYINGVLKDAINAPGFDMPRGSGFLGARNAAGSAGMVGRIERVTAHSGSLHPDVIRKYGAAFQRVCLSHVYDASVRTGDPLLQGWIGSEVTEPGSDTNSDGVLDDDANVGLVSGPAWQTYDRRAETSLNSPQYNRPISSAQLGAFHDYGWTMEVTVRPVGVANTTSHFVGWQFRQAHDPGYGVTQSAARVGFYITEEPGAAFGVQAVVGDKVTLAAGSASMPHTIRAVAQPNSAVYEWFLDGESQGMLDLRDANFGNSESIQFGATSSSGIGDAADWFRVSLWAGRSVESLQAAPALTREMDDHSDSIVGDGIDTATGSFVRAHEVLSVTGVRDVSLPIFYDSRLTDRRGPLGDGWSHPYEARLQCCANGDVFVHWDANRSSRFIRSDGSSYKGADEDMQYAVLEEIPVGTDVPPDTWKLTLLDGTLYAFSRLDGRLEYVANSAKQGLEMTYDSERRLVSIKDEHSPAKLDLGYNENHLLVTVEDPLNRKVTLVYDEASRLISIPDPLVPDERDYEVDVGTMIPIPDNAPEGAGLTLNVPDSGAVGRVTITFLEGYHERVGDLSFTLTSPEGTTVDVPLQLTGEEYFADDVVFETEFEGESRTGEWTLTGIDGVAGVTGEVNYFSLKLSSGEVARALLLTYDGNLITAGHDVLGELLFSCGYDSLGRLVSKDDGREDTPPSTMTYTDLGSDTIETAVTDPAGHVYTFIHDTGFHLLSATNPLGHTASFTYDDFGNRLSRTDARGHTQSFTYDDFGNLSSFTDEAGNRSTFSSGSNHFINEINDTFDRSTSLLYTDKRLTAVRDAEGNQDSKIYHSNGQVSRIALQDGARMELDLDDRQLITARRLDSEAGATYDRAGRLRSMTNGAGDTTSYVLNPSGDIIETTDGEGRSVRAEFDHRGRRLQTIDARGGVTSFTYNGNNSLLTVTNALGEVITYHHDVLDRVIGVTNPRGYRTDYRYDAIGRRIEVKDALGRQTRTEYDEVGNVTARIDAQGVRVLAITYDERSLPIRVEDALGHVTTAAYDEVGRKVSATDAKGRTTLFHYDALDRPTGVTDPLGRRSEAAYDSDDALVQQKPPGIDSELGIEYDYDDLSNRLARITWPEGGSLEYGYDSAGRLAVILQRDSSSIRGQNLSYDGVGRLIKSEEIPKNAVTTRREYTYDPSGNLTRIQHLFQLPQLGGLPPNPIVSLGSNTRAYDALNRLTRYTDQAGNEIGYGYDAAGNLTSLTYPGNWTVTYTYDAADRLTTVTDGDGRVTQYVYDRRDQVTQVRFPNGTVRNLSYDIGGRLLFREVLDANGGMIVSYRYTYSSAGQLQSEEVEPAETSIGVTPRVQIRYNERNQLTFTADNTPVSYNEFGDMTGRWGVDWEDISYDIRGRMTGAKNYEYSYDVEDRLIGWRKKDGSTETTFVVNPHGSLSQILSETTDGTLTRYVYGMGLLYQVTGSDTLTSHYDQRGSAVAFSDGSGETVGRVSYGPYGILTNREGNSDSIFLFNGLFGVVYGPDFFNYMRFRWYWPEMGRFLTEDAHFGNVNQIGSLNRYAYAHGNPIMQIDPEGEAPWIAIGAALGAVVGGTGELIGSAIEGREVDWGQVGAAAAGGAVAGGLLAATGGTSAIATAGAAFGAGFAGGATEYLVDSAISGSDVHPGDLAWKSVTGGAYGVAGAGVGAGLGKIGAKLFKPIGQRLGRVGSRSRLLFAPEKVSRRQGIRSINQLVDRMESRAMLRQQASVIQGFFTDLGAETGVQLWKHLPMGIGSDQRDAGAGAITIYQDGLGEINQGRLNTYGEFAHYRLYLGALSLADRPIPNNPSNTLTSF